MRLSLNQRGISNVLFPLIILAAIGLGVYLVQQQTELTPSAQEVQTTAPTGCIKVTPSNRHVRYKNCSSSSQNCSDQTNLLPSTQEHDNDANWEFDGKKVATYALKESVWDFGSWKNFTTKGPRQNDGDRLNTGKPRFDGPGGKSYHETDTDEIPGGYKVKYGDGQVIEYAYSNPGTNYQGLSGNRYDPGKSYAFVPSDPNSSTKCDGTGSNNKKDVGASCSNRSECKSDICTNGRCAEGSKTNGTSCSNDSECQSGNCGSNNRCQAGTGGSGDSCQNAGDCASGRCTNGRCTAPTPTPSPSRPAASSGGGGGGGGTTSPAPSASISTSPAPSASAISSASPAPSGTPAAISLTKAEIIQFKASFDALYARLGATKDAGNLRITSTLANNELNSIVSELNTCPDDANVGQCLSKFDARFRFAKTAARLSAFYGIFNGVSGICVKSDFGIQPLITATSSNNTQGRVNLCTEPTAAAKIWRIFVGGKFEPVLATDTRWPSNPTCAAIPQDVMSHYRNAEFIFNGQSGFINNTLCDGKTAIEDPGGSDNPSPSTVPSPNPSVAPSPSPSPSASASASKGLDIIGAIFTYGGLS